MKFIALYFTALALVGCAEPMPIIHVTINRHPYQLKDGATITYRDAATGKFTPLTITNP